MSKAISPEETTVGQTVAKWHPNTVVNTNAFFAVKSNYPPDPVVAGIKNPFLFCGEREIRWPRQLEVQREWAAY